MLTRGSRHRLSLRKSRVVFLNGGAHMKDKPMILSQTFAQTYANDSIPKKINTAIPDARAIVSVVHERDEVGNLLVTVYYRG